jgi:hypothetical protein
MDARGMELRDSWLRDKTGLLRVERSSEMAGKAGQDMRIVS